MPAQTYFVIFKPPDILAETVVADRYEIHEDHLAFTDGDGKLVALFHLDLVHRWGLVEDEATT